jgi:hypothetical protein
MTTQELMMILGPSLAGGIGSAVNSRQQGQQNQQNQQNQAVQQQMQMLAQKAQILQGLQQNRQQMAQAGLNAMPLGQEQAYASRAKAMQALLPMLAQYQGARPTDPGIAGATRSSGPNLVQGLAGNKGFQNTFSDQMTSQAMADRRKAVAGVNPQYEFSSLGGYGMDPFYDQTVDDARGTALARLKGFEGQQQALADQQVQLAMQQGAQAQGQQEQKGGGVKGFLGGLLKTAAPFAAFIPGVGPLAAVGWGAAGGALGNKLQGGGLVSGAAQGAIGAGLGAAGKSLASGQGLNPFNNGAGRAMSNGMTAASLPLGSGVGQTVASKAGNMVIAPPTGGPSWLSGARSAGNNLLGNIATSQAGFEGNDPSIGFGNISTQMPQGPVQQPKLPMFNKADPRGGPQQPPPSAPTPSGFNPQGYPLRNAGPYTGPGSTSAGISANPRGTMFGLELQNIIDSQPFVQAMRSPVGMLAGGAVAGQSMPRPTELGPGPGLPPNPQRALPPGQYNMGPASSKPYYDTTATNWPTPPQGRLGAGPQPKLLGPGPQTPQVLPPGAMPMGPVGSSSMARGSAFNLPAQSGSTVNNQINAQRIMQVLSSNNGMTPQQKAQFLATPQAQAILQQLQTAQKLPAGMRPDQIMRMIIGGQ